MKLSIKDAAREEQEEIIRRSLNCGEAAAIRSRSSQGIRQRKIIEKNFRNAVIWEGQSFIGFKEIAANARSEARVLYPLPRFLRFTERNVPYAFENSLPISL